MNKKITLGIIAALCIVLIPNPVMGDVLGAISPSGYTNADPTMTENQSPLTANTPSSISVPNYGYSGVPQSSYVQSHYGIATCNSAFQYTFLCDRLDVMIQQNDQIVANQGTIIAQNTQMEKNQVAIVCMTGYGSHTNFIGYASNFGVNCNVGKQ